MAARGADEPFAKTIAEGATEEIRNRNVRDSDAMVLLPKTIYFREPCLVGVFKPWIKAVGQNYITSSRSPSSDRFLYHRAAIGRSVLSLLVALLLVTVLIGYLSTPRLGGPVMFETSSSLTKTIKSHNLASSSQSSFQSTTRASCYVGRDGITTIAYAVGQSGPQCGCEFATQNSNGTLYVSPAPRVGDYVCLQANTIAPVQVVFKVMDSGGSVVFSSSNYCVDYARTRLPDQTFFSCTALWDTSKPNLQRSLIQPGIYHLVAANAAGAALIEASLTLS